MPRTAPRSRFQVPVVTIGSDLRHSENVAFDGGDTR
jgi:hypothetical protein